jgi:hypothetical protein
MVQGELAGDGAYPRTVDVAVMKARCHPLTAAFYDYWRDKAGERFAPTRDDIDPIDMKPWLAGVQLLSVDHAARRLTYRVVGEVNIAARGFNPTGMSVEEGGIGTSVADVLHEYWLVVDHRTMVYNWAEVPCGGGYLLAQETIYLPLSDDGIRVDRVITYSVVSHS